jgi:hypothetical protein
MTSHFEVPAAADPPLDPPIKTADRAIDPAREEEERDRERGLMREQARALFSRKMSTPEKVGREQAVLILYSYCTHTVLMMYSYCTHAVLML